MTGEQLSRNGPGAAGDSRLRFSQQYVLASRRQIVFWVALSTAQPDGPKVTVLLYLVLVQHHLEYRVQFSSPQHRKIVEVIESIQKRATQLVTEQESTLCERS